VSSKHATRQEIDEIAWEAIDAHVSPTRPDGYRSSRPSNYIELWEAIQSFTPDIEDTSPMPWAWPAFEHAWSNFLHEFFCWRTTGFFSEPPPTCFGPEHAALLAGTAEYLCHRYDLDVPEWVSDPRYRLRDLWDVEGYLNPRETLYRRVQRSEPEFLSRNVVFEARNLITL
jgi:hypothetical protein